LGEISNGFKLEKLLLFEFCVFPLKLDCKGGCFVGIFDMLKTTGDFDIS